MKKIVGFVLSLALLAGAVVPTWAQPTNGRNADASRRAAQNRRYEQTRRDDNRRYDRYDRRDDNESFWEEHRDKVTVAAGAGAGAVVGGAAGGKKGALVGALIGVGGSALYTYVLRDRDDDDRDYRRRY
jgi:hypothetical protein